jgi:hypothetical protein
MDGGKDPALLVPQKFNTFNTFNTFNIFKLFEFFAAIIQCPQSGPQALSTKALAA